AHTDPSNLGVCPAMRANRERERQVSGVNAPNPEAGRQTPDSSVLLEVRELKKYFPLHRGPFRRVVGQVKAVDGVSVRIHAGETRGLVGEPGWGRTTIGGLVLRATEPTDGQVLLRRDGAMLDLTTLSRRQLKPIRRDVQVIFQDPFSSLSPRMTVLDIVSEPL